MAKKILWSPQSEKDFENILIYLSSEWDANVAVKFIDLLDALLMQIASNPRQFPLIHKKHNIRKCVITKHNTLQTNCKMWLH
jgi:plasmid stabilization system protein ParE